MIRTDAATRALLERVEGMLPPGAVREVRMFGTVAVMLEDRMLVAATRRGGLLVRVRPEDDAYLVTVPGAARAEMGAGRSMGAGWIDVHPDAVAQDGDLSAWVEHALRAARVA